MSSKPDPQERNNAEHIKWILPVVKDMQRRIEASEAELKRLRIIVERAESE